VGQLSVVVKDKGQLKTTCTLHHDGVTAVGKNTVMWQYYSLLYLWSKCAAVIGSNRVTWC